MSSLRRTVAEQLLLISPALLFMAALVVRQLSSLQEEPAHTAHWIVMWYAGRVWTLWLLLITLPLAGLITGCFTLSHRTRNHSEPPQAGQPKLRAIHTDRAMLFIAVMTLSAGVILVIVAMHMAAN